MSDEYDLLLTLARVLQRAKARYFVSGSVAAMYYGEARMTRDIDVVIELRYGDVQPIMEAFREPEYFVQRESIIRALQESGSFNVIAVTTDEDRFHVRGS